MHPRILQRAHSRLLRKSPFLGLFLVRLPLRPRPDIATARTNGVTIDYNPEWIRSLNLDHVTAVLAHEIYHVLLLHHIRRGRRDDVLWNVAGDHVVNLLLTEQEFRLPKRCLCDPKFAGQSTEQVYAQLKDQEPDSSNDTADGLGDVTDAPTPSKAGPGPGRPKPAPLATERGVQIATFQAAQHARRVGAPVPDAIERQLGQLYDESSRLDWQALLHRFVERCVSGRGDGWSYLRPSPYFLQQGIVLPTLVSETVEVLPVAVDTSGSISADELKLIERELRAILASDRVEGIRVLHVDTEVRRDETVHAGQPWELHARGGGGTDFRPVFDLLDGHPVPGLVYITDLAGVFPETPPTFPTLWITPVAVSCRPVSFGEVVTMTTDR